jgi:alpha-mannosidase
VDRRHKEIALSIDDRDGESHALDLRGWVGAIDGEPGEPGKRLFMRECALVQIDTPTRALAAWARVALQAAEHLEDTSPSRADVIQALDEFPDFHFSESQPQLYQYAREEDPALFARIQDRVREGRWEPLGGAWIEPDCNVTGAESLARQFPLGRRYFADPAISIRVVEHGPLRATLEIERRILNSAYVQRISLSRDNPQIDFVTEIDWREKHILLKTAFPVDLLSPVATYEIQWAHIERPTHRNTSWDWARFEVPAQKWAALREDDYIVALLNDCKYVYDVHDNTLRLSLLRAPTFPDPDQRSATTLPD